jgi:plasmid stabilization system protein ParE
MSNTARLRHNKDLPANAAREIIGVGYRIIRYKYVLIAYLMRAQNADILNITTGGMYSQPLGV